MVRDINSFRISHLMTNKVILGMVRAAKGHKAPEWEEIAAVGCAVQVISPWNFERSQKCMIFDKNLLVIKIALPR